jgi:hypothetical protein
MPPRLTISEWIESLEYADGNIYRELGVDSADQIEPYNRRDGSTLYWKRYRRAVKAALAKLGFSTRRKVPEKVRKGLENDNYHTLNHAIDQLGIGEGRYGFEPREERIMFGPRGREFNLLPWNAPDRARFR